MTSCKHKCCVYRQKQACARPRHLSRVCFSATFKLCHGRKAGGAHDDTIISTLEAAQAQYQHKQYDLCLLTLHILTDTAGTSPPEAQALTAICKIHKHAAVQEWHKVKLLTLGCCQPEPLVDMTSSCSCSGCPAYPLTAVTIYIHFNIHSLPCDLHICRPGMSSASMSAES